MHSSRWSARTTAVARPATIGRMDWAILLATEQEGRFLKMDFYAGRSGTLQGRKNKRTFRMAFKARTQQDSTELRLHLKNDVDFPLIGYELYERVLKSRAMTFVGRTDWNGSLNISKSESRCDCCTSRTAVRCWHDCRSSPDCTRMQWLI